MKAPITMFDGVEARLAAVCAACLARTEDPADVDCTTCILGDSRDEDLEEGEEDDHA